MNYVDANVLIYAFVDKTQKGKSAIELLSRERLVTSTLSLDEVAYKIMKYKSREEALLAVQILITTPTLTLVAFNVEDGELFQEFLRKGLGPRDSVHALTAKKMKCPILYSEDKNFDSVTDFVRKTPW